MKTTSLFAFTLLLMLGLVARHDAGTEGQLMTDQPTSIVNEMPSPPAIGGWYIFMDTCPGTETINCCCSDGNGHTCIALSVYFYCRPGGPFDCTKDLGNCEENPSICDTCCPDGRC